MRSSRSPQRPAALVVAIIALVAALTGGAVAQVASTAFLTKPERKQVRKISNRQITKRAPGGRVLIRVSSETLADGEQEVVDAHCATGERILGGGEAGVGFGAPMGPDAPYLVVSRPLSAGTGFPSDGQPLAGWRAGAQNSAGGIGGTTLSAYAMCLHPGR